METNQIEGESCLQVLTDGYKSHQHDGLIFELRGSVYLENILKKEGSLKNR